MRVPMISISIAKNAAAKLVAPRCPRRQVGWFCHEQHYTNGWMRAASSYGDRRFVSSTTTTTTDSVAHAAQEGKQKKTKKENDKGTMELPVTIKSLRNNQEKVQLMQQRMRDDTSSAVKAAAWESLHQDGITPWDLGRPTPAFASELEKEKERVFQSAALSTMDDDDGGGGAGYCFRALVPGCGAGYDLMTLAMHCDELIAAGQLAHATIVGLEISPTSLDRASVAIETNLMEFCPFDRPTRIELVQGDFFDTDTWETRYSYGGDASSIASRRPCRHKRPASPTPSPTFHFIFDYLFFCALPPHLRRQWGEQTARLLVPDKGRLLTLIFPMADKSTSTLTHQHSSNPDHSNSNNNNKSKLQQGPPYLVSVEDYVRVLEPMGVQMDPDGPHANPDTVAPRVGREVACWWTRRRIQNENATANATTHFNPQEQHPRSKL